VRLIFYKYKIESTAFLEYILPLGHSFPPVIKQTT